MGKEKILNFRSEFKGGIRSGPKEKFMPLKSVQYNFMDKYARFFYIEASRMGVPAKGLHIYQHANAVFQIKILGLFPVVHAKGPRMDQGETVTVLNDLFFMAPGALIDQRIQWEVLDELRVRAVFTNEHICVRAEVDFDKEGKLTNFISYDRFETNGKEYHNYPWETPVLSYGDYNGYRLPARARLIYRRPDGELSLIHISEPTRPY